MTVISLFCGIKVLMNFSDHNPPHYYVRYGKFRALVDIQDGSIISGYLPSRQLKLVLAWNELHRDELMQDWELCRDDKQPERIKPLN